MRVRRAGWAGLLILAAATLLSRSMSLASGSGGSAPASTVSLRVSAGEPVALSEGEAGLLPSEIWAVPAPAWFFRGTGRAAPGTGAGSPDGMRFVPVKLTVGAARPVIMFTNAATLVGLMQAMDLELNPLDRVQPRGIATLFLGADIRLIRISRFRESGLEIIPFATVIHYSSDLPAAAVRIVSPGRPGQLSIVYRVTKRNGEVVRREVLSVRLASAPVAQVEVHGTRPPAPHVQYGQASWYRCSGMNAAHVTLPFGTRVTVMNLDNARSVTVVINDRGPYGVPGRIIDLCDPAFSFLAPLGQGVANVQISW